MIMQKNPKQLWIPRSSSGVVQFYFTSQGTVDFDQLVPK